MTVSRRSSFRKEKHTGFPQAKPKRVKARRLSVGGVDSEETISQTFSRVWRDILPTHLSKEYMDLAEIRGKVREYAEREGL